jgi:hypothetical protein
MSYSLVSRRRVSGELLILDDLPSLWTTVSETRNDLDVGLYYQPASDT